MLVRTAGEIRGKSLCGPRVFSRVLRKSWKSRGKSVHLFGSVGSSLSSFEALITNQGTHCLPHTALSCLSTSDARPMWSILFGLRSVPSYRY